MLPECTTRATQIHWKGLRDKSKAQFKKFLHLGNFKNEFNFISLNHFKPWKEKNNSSFMFMSSEVWAFFIRMEVMMNFCLF